MSIFTLLVTLLLSGSTGWTAHPNGVSGGGPTTGIQAADSISNPIPAIVIGGGPIS